MKARSALQWSDGAAGPVLRLVPDEAAPPCATSDADFFPETDAGAGPAQAICATCPLRASCLAAALERREPWGVWGGVLFEQGSPYAPKRSSVRTVEPGSDLGNGRVAGAVSLWCESNHRRSTTNTRTEAGGKVVCLECERKRTQKSRGRKLPQSRFAGAVSLWCTNRHRRSVSNTRTNAAGHVVCLDCRRAGRARKAGRRFRPVAGAVSLWCRSNHRRSVTNTRTDGAGRTVCLDCRRATDRRRYAAQKAGITRQGLELVA